MLLKNGFRQVTLYEELITDGQSKKENGSPGVVEGPGDRTRCRYEVMAFDTAEWSAVTSAGFRTLYCSGLGRVR